MSVAVPSLHSGFETEHADPNDKTVSGSATGFVVTVDGRAPFVISNRHVVDLNYRQPGAKYKDFRLTALRITGRRADDSVYIALAT